MKKREVFNKYNEIDTRIGRGTSLINILQYWTFNPSQLMIQASAYQIALWALDGKKLLWITLYTKWISFFMIVIAIILKDYLMKLINYLLGRWDEKRLGLWKATNEYNQTKEHISPFNDSLRRTIENICKKVGVKSEFNK